MSNQNSASDIRISSENCLPSRRILLQGLAIGAALAIAPAAAGAALADNYDTLMMLIDERDELYSQFTYCQDRIEALSAADIPPEPMIALCDTFDEEHLWRFYPHISPRMKFRFVEDIDKFYTLRLHYANVRARAVPAASDFPRQMQLDWDIIRAKLVTADDRRTRYFEDSGWNALDELAEALNEQRLAVEDRVFAIPCRSLRDILVKIDIAERWLDQNVGGNVVALMTILRSMRDLSKAGVST